MQGKPPAEIEPIYREALPMWRAEINSSKPHKPKAEFSFCLSNLGKVLNDQLKLAEAEPLFHEALDIMREIFPKDKLTPRHFALAEAILTMASCQRDLGRLAEAEQLSREALELQQRLYPDPKGNPLLAQSMGNLAGILIHRGKLGEAEKLSKDALEMRRRLHTPSNKKEPDDHPDIARSLNNLAAVISAQGKPARAELLYREALAMNERLYPKSLFPEGHLHLAASLNNLAGVIQEQGNDRDAAPLYRQAEAMRRRLFTPPGRKLPDDHPDLAESLNNVGGALDGLGEFEEAEKYYRSSLEMSQRLGKDRPDGGRAVALILNNLAEVLRRRGNLQEAEEMHLDTLRIRRQLYPNKEYPHGHRDLTVSLTNLAVVHLARESKEEAEACCREALAMHAALTEEYAKTRGEGDALMMDRHFPIARDLYLSLDSHGTNGNRDYGAIWPSRAVVSRTAEAKNLAARAATASPEVRLLWEKVSELRRRRAELLLARVTSDPETLEARSKLLEAWDSEIKHLDEKLAEALPAVQRVEELAKSVPSDLQKRLSEDAAFVEFLRYTRMTLDLSKASVLKEKDRIPSYVAFVVTQQSIRRVELGPADRIEAGVTAWRADIAKRRPDGDHPATLYKMVWDKLAPHLPDPVSVVYLAPDMALAGVPWGALQKDNGRVLLEDHAILLVPHGQFLLGQLKATAPEKAADRPLLLVSEVAYADEPAGPPSSPLPELVAARAGGIQWAPLPGTAKEGKVFTALADCRGLTVKPLSGPAASTAAVLAELPKARVTHLGTHGFFADAKFRSELQLDPKLFEMRGSERVGPGTLSPFVLSGLVFAGADRPDTPGRGIATAESFVGTDLSGLELAVLSACETGLGDVAAGEGVYGLQKAFHIAGCENVIASLWKVEDDATAALMGLFYHNLLVKGMPPAEALRLAQLTIYRKPGLIKKLSRRRAVSFAEHKIPEIAEEPAVAGETTPAWAWAAFTFSGLGHRPIVDPMNEPDIMEEPELIREFGRPAFWAVVAAAGIVAACLGAWAFRRRRCRQAGPTATRPSRNHST